MTFDRSTISRDLEVVDVDLAFSSFIAPQLENEINQDIINLISDSDNWTFVLKTWVSYVRNSFNAICPEIVKTNNLLSLGLIFTDDLHIANLNKKWRNKNEPTDVLSFPALDTNMGFLSGQFVELGDIVVSVDTACKQAKLHKHDLIHELRWLVSHGFLHLMGWDHPTKSSLEDMLNFQEELLKTHANLLSNK